MSWDSSSMAALTRPSFLSSYSALGKLCMCYLLSLCHYSNSDLLDTVDPQLISVTEWAAMVGEIKELGNRGWCIIWVMHANMHSLHDFIIDVEFHSDL